MNKKLILLVLLVLVMAYAIAQVIPYPVDTAEYNAYKQGLIGRGWIPASAGMTEGKAGMPEGKAGMISENAGMPKLLPLSYQQQTRTGLLVPYDASFQLAFSGSDDGYTSSIAIPFAFDFYGTTQSSFYINNNGNVSFGNPYSTYNPSGFPIAEYPMLSAFWADVDTRLAASGKVYYKVEATRVTVIWNGVGYYNNKTDKLNTFELIFTNGTDPLIGIGKNVAFSYGDMQWTTGDASGGTNGFGGTPSTVGLNKGDGINYGLIGRFDHEGTDYNGPGGAASGISYLDNQLFTFNTLMGNNIPPLFTNVPTAPVMLQVGNSRTLNISVVSPLPTNIVSAVVQHNFTSGLTVSVIPGNPCQISIQVTGNAANLGNHTVTIVASDNGTPILESTTSFTIGIISLSEYVFVANRLSSDISVIDTATNAVYGPFLTGQLGSNYLADFVVSPNSQFALVSNFNNNTVYQLDISNPLNPSLLASYVLSFRAEDITLSYDGRFAIVADGGTTTMLAVIDLQSRATIQNLNISPRFAQGVSISIDGKVLVNDYHNGYVYQYLLNLQTGMLTDSGSSIAISSAFNSAISPSGEYAIACGGSASNTKLLKLNQDNSLTVVQTIESIGSQSAVYSPDGSKVLIAVIGSPSKLHVYNVQPDGTLLFASSYNLSEYSSGGYFGVDPLAINSANSKAYASNLYETYANVHAIDLTTGTLTYLPTGSPVGLAIANLPLKAYFSYKSSSLLLTNSVQFKQFSTGAPQSYLWSFGDGNSSTAQNPNHEYSSPGIYTVSLTVTRGTFTNTATQSVTIAFDANIHLTAAGSPYFFSNSINIMAGQTLTIDSGVMVNFAPGTGLTVNGIITANSATFTGSETAGWNGIIINSTLSPLTFNNCTILNGIQALTLESTSLNILNLLISKTNVFPDELGISVQGYSNVTLTNVQVLNYIRGIVFNNPDVRISSSPTLSNVRIRNTSSSVRTDCTGLEVIGSVALIINGAEIEEYDNGIVWDGQGASFRTTPTLGNVRIRNTSSSVRNASFGIKLLNLSSVIVESDSIGGYPNGLHIENNLPDNRLSSTATLGNVRIRNTSSSVRTDTFGATILGSIASTINNMEISYYSTGMYIEGDSTATRISASTTLGNVRIRNTSS
ncbi:MAG: PKD domain-containing protein, partial [Candidatus Cloacimonas sp.]|nr:PKD domain-containing protein [Candidatus Cloacimonas sp.]